MPTFSRRHLRGAALAFLLGVVAKVVSYAVLPPIQQVKHAHRTNNGNDPARLNKSSIPKSEELSFDRPSSLCGNVSGFANLLRAMPNWAANSPEEALRYLKACKRESLMVPHFSLLEEAWLANASGWMRQNKELAKAAAGELLFAQLQRSTDDFSAFVLNQRLAFGGEDRGPEFRSQQIAAKFSQSTQDGLSFCGSITDSIAWEKAVLGAVGFLQTGEQLQALIGQAQNRHPTSNTVLLALNTRLIELGDVSSLENARMISDIKYKEQFYRNALYAPNRMIAGKAFMELWLSGTDPRTLEATISTRTVSAQDVEHALAEVRRNATGDESWTESKLTQLEEFLAGIKATSEFAKSEPIQAKLTWETLEHGAAFSESASKNAATELISESLDNGDDPLSLSSAISQITDRGVQSSMWLAWVEAVAKVEPEIALSVMSRLPADSINQPMMASLVRAMKCDDPTLKAYWLTAISSEEQRLILLNALNIQLE